MAATRHLAAIMSADVVGYSRLMGHDEERTLARLKATQHTITGPAIERNNGRLVKTYGDGLLAEFGSVLDATSCAIEIQCNIAKSESAEPEEERFAFRIGVNLGDVIRDGEDIFGDGVNIAARLEAFAAPTEICISGSVRDAVRGKLKVRFEDRGEQSFKNISEPVHVFAVLWDMADWESRSGFVVEQPTEAMPVQAPPPKALPVETAQGRRGLPLTFAAIGIAAVALGGFGAWFLSQSHAPSAAVLATPSPHASPSASPAVTGSVIAKPPPVAPVVPKPVTAAVAAPAVKPTATPVPVPKSVPAAAEPPPAAEPSAGTAQAVPAANVRPVIPADSDPVAPPSPGASAP